MTIPRRTLLLGVGAAAALTALPHPARAADPGLGTWTGDHSDNGWLIDADAIEPFHVEGSPVIVHLHPAAAVQLLHVARRWHYEVLPLRGSEDIQGHRADRAVRAAYESNFLSGTALSLPGAGDGLWPHQRQIVRDILADCDGVVRWGADLFPVAENHFQIDRGPDSADFHRLTEELRDRSVRRRGPRPGAVDDPAAPVRRDRASSLARVQGRN
jgi:hypothetical protein